jgi:peptide deformylase
LRDVGERLLAAARAAQAYGLAAAHIGEIAPAVVVSGETRAYRVLFNPAVVQVAPETATAEEGSVSLPGVRVEVVRPVWSEVEAMDADGMPQRFRFEG